MNIRATVFFLSLLCRLPAGAEPIACDFEHGPFWLDGVKEVELEFRLHFEDPQHNGIDKEALRKQVAQAMADLNIETLARSAEDTGRPIPNAQRGRDVFRTVLAGKAKGGRYVTAIQFELWRANESSWSKYVIGWAKDDLIYAGIGRSGVVLKTVVAAMLEDFTQCWQVANRPEYASLRKQLADEKRKVNEPTQGDPPWPDLSVVAERKESSLPLREAPALTSHRNATLEIEVEVLDRSQSARLVLSGRRQKGSYIGCEFVYSPTGKKIQLRVIAATKRAVSDIGQPEKQITDEKGRLRLSVWEDQAHCFFGDQLIDSARFPKPVDAGIFFWSGVNVRLSNSRFATFSP